MSDSSPVWTLLADVSEVAAAVVARISSTATRAIGDHHRFRLVLAGGRTPQAAYQLLRDTDQDWSHWEVYFGDERCLPVEHRDRNSRMAAEALLDHVAIPSGQVYRIPAELGPSRAAQAYQTVISRRLPFDLVLLGIGEDGHTASLFPGCAMDRAALVVAVKNAPKPPPQRVSLGYAALRQTAKLLVVVTGEDKQAAVQRWRAGEDLPITRIIGASEVVEVLIDKAALGADGREYV